MKTGPRMFGMEWIPAATTTPAAKPENDDQPAGQAIAVLRVRL